MWSTKMLIQQKHSVELQFQGVGGKDYTMIVMTNLGEFVQRMVATINTNNCIMEKVLSVYQVTRKTTLLLL